MVKNVLWQPRGNNPNGGILSNIIVAIELDTFKETVLNVYRNHLTLEGQEAQTNQWHFKQSEAIHEANQVQATKFRWMTLKVTQSYWVSNQSCISNKCCVRMDYWIVDSVQPLIYAMTTRCLTDEKPFRWETIQDQTVILGEAHCLIAKASGIVELQQQLLDGANKDIDYMIYYNMYPIYRKSPECLQVNWNWKSEFLDTQCFITKDMAGTNILCHERSLVFAKSEYKFWK